MVFLFPSNVGVSACFHCVILVSIYREVLFSLCILPVSIIQLLIPVTVDILPVSIMQVLLVSV